MRADELLETQILSGFPVAVLDATSTPAEAEWVLLNLARRQDNRALAQALLRLRETRGREGVRLFFRALQTYEDLPLSVEPLLETVSAPKPVATARPETASRAGWSLLESVAYLLDRLAGLELLGRDDVRGDARRLTRQAVDQITSEGFSPTADCEPGACAAYDPSVHQVLSGTAPPAGALVVLLTPPFRDTLGRVVRRAWVRASSQDVTPGLGRVTE